MAFTSTSISSETEKYILCILSPISPILPAPYQSRWELTFTIIQLCELKLNHVHFLKSLSLSDIHDLVLAAHETHELG